MSAETRGHTEQGAVERAAEVIRGLDRHAPNCFLSMPPFYCHNCIAQALADAGRLLSDVDRAVLDAADQWLVAAEVGAPWQQSTAGLEAAVRARRETSS